MICRCGIHVTFVFKSHIGSTLTRGKETIISVSQKQEPNTKISTEADLVDADDA